MLASGPGNHTLELIFKGIEKFGEANVADLLRILVHLS
jgi:hypothetical protein